ncbi:hypothetical protein KIPB_013643 [Kipferlia bialata]|uniref:Uncharacterized protein n=1 Tax=Kipferlia bialata TaxID=797122 RepID=A0A391NSI6_9EUKA|nr:hypothetical protein KIPB_013643 [Kipferlia bialata]|eukprot:g13643.t1
MSDGSGQGGLSFSSFPAAKKKADPESHSSTTVTFSSFPAGAGAKKKPAAPSVETPAPSGPVEGPKRRRRHHRTSEGPGRPHRSRGRRERERETDEKLFKEDKRPRVGGSDVDGPSAKRERGRKSGRSERYYSTVMGGGERERERETEGDTPMDGDNLPDGQGVGEREGSRVNTGILLSLLSDTGSVSLPETEKAIRRR